MGVITYPYWDWGLFILVKGAAGNEIPLLQNM